MVVLRPFTVEDIGSVVAVQNLDPVTYRLDEAELRDDLQTLPPHLVPHIVVADDAGEVVGWSGLQADAGSYHPRHVVVELFVRPDRRRQGTGGLLFDRVLADAARSQFESLRVQVRESSAGAVAFARSRGFETTKKDFVSALDVTGFDPVQFAQRVPVTVVPFDQVDTPDLRRAWHATFSEVRMDVPRAQLPSPIDFPFFDRQVAGHADLVREATCFAIDHGGLVGFTGCFRTETAGEAHQWLTGVKRSHRGHGIALALKVASITALQRLGFSRVLTDNDTLNEPMLTVNGRLGFVRGPTVLSMVKRL